MSTTPSIFKKPRAPYTVVGGPKADRIRRRTSPVTILLLNRGGRFYRQELLAELQELQLGEILCIEGPQMPYDLEPLSRQFPAVRFLLLQQDSSPGEKINLGVGEARSALVLVFWSDMRPESTRLGEALGEQAGRSELLCAVPQLRNPKAAILPSIQVPALIKGGLKLLPWKPVQGGMRSLFPFDYCGIYSRKRFLQLGGYDSWMANPYWQKLDFGFRAFLWGESIACNTRFQLSYTGEPEAGDSTPDVSYKLFFLKNLAVRYNGEAGLLPLSRLPRYLLRSDSGLFDSLKEFSEVCKWVHENRYRFKMDAQSLISRWEMPE